MNITRMNILDIMSESVRTSIVNTDNQTIDEIAESVATQVQLLDEMDIELRFTPEMVPVVFDEATGSYFVEYEMLAKLHEDCDDCIELETKYGKIKFEPKEDKEEECKMDEPGDESITEEDPEDDDKNDDYEDDEEDKNEIEESWNPFWTPGPSCGGCWEKDALSQVILANLVRDPNREELDKKNSCEIPEMTMENTYIVIESEDEMFDRIFEVSEAAKSGGVAMKNGKAQLKKASEVFQNMINHGLKVVKKKKVVKEDARQKYIELQDKKINSRAAKNEGTDFFLNESSQASKEIRKQAEEVKKIMIKANKFKKAGKTEDYNRELKKANALIKEMKKKSKDLDDGEFMFYIFG